MTIVIIATLVVALVLFLFHISDDPILYHRSGITCFRALGLVFIMIMMGGCSDDFTAAQTVIEEPECIRNSDCEVGELCDNESLTCFVAECLSSDECEVGKVCQFGLCEPGCYFDSDCALGWSCQENYGAERLEFYCQPTRCGHVSECPRNFICNESYCEPGSCLSDDDCSTEVEPEVVPEEEALECEQHSECLSDELCHDNSCKSLIPETCQVNITEIGSGTHVKLYSDGNSYLVTWYDYSGPREGIFLDPNGNPFGEKVTLANSAEYGVHNVFPSANGGYTWIQEYDDEITSYDFDSQGGLMNSKVILRSRRDDPNLDQCNIRNAIGTSTNVDHLVWATHCWSENEGAYTFFSKGILLDGDLAWQSFFPHEPGHLFTWRSAATQNTTGFLWRTDDDHQNLTVIGQDDPVTTTVFHETNNRFVLKMLGADEHYNLFIRNNIEGTQILRRIDLQGNTIGINSTPDLIDVIPAKDGYGDDGFAGIFHQFLDYSIVFKKFPSTGNKTHYDLHLTNTRVDLWSGPRLAQAGNTYAVVWGLEYDHDYAVKMAVISGCDYPK